MMNLFKTDASYKEVIKKFTKQDAFMAFGIWFNVMVIYYVMGQLYATKNIYLGTPVNLLLAVLCIGIILLKKEKLSSIGLSRKNVMKSVMLGLVIGVTFVGVNVIISIISNGQFDSLHNILIKLQYYMFTIALVEEIIFRGFIQPRLYGLIKNSVLAITLGAVLFMLMHIPFQMGYAGMSITEYISYNGITLCFTFVWHIVFDYLYRKYNSIYAPTIFHGLMDWGNYLFI